MGCDIHLHTEVKINGKWEHYSHQSVDRDYRLFYYIAGVRGPGPEILSHPLGLPDDLSVVTTLDYKEWEDDAHSHSYFDQAKIAQLFKWADNNTDGFAGRYSASELFGYVFGNYWDNFKDLPDEVTDTRFVFWFDN